PEAIGFGRRHDSLPPETHARGPVNPFGPVGKPRRTPPTRRNDRAPRRPHRTEPGPDGGRQRFPIILVDTRRSNKLVRPWSLVLPGFAPARSAARRRSAGALPATREGCASGPSRTG